MRKSLPRWTKKEDRILLRQVATTPKMSKAFEKAARLLENRTVLSCKQRWYKIKAEDKNLCFMTIGKNYTIRNNRQETQKTKAVKHKVSFWKKFLNLFKS